MKQNVLGAFKKLLTFLTDGSGYFEKKANDDHVDGHSAWPDGGIFKQSLCPALVLRLIWSFLQRYYGLPTTPLMPPHIAEKQHELVKNCHFSAICWGIGGFVGKP